MKTTTNHEKSSCFVRAWLIWFVSAFFMFYKYIIEVSPSVMNTTLMKTFGIGGIELGNLAACYFYAYMILQIPAGLLLDHFGPRKTTTVAIALCALGSMVFAMAETIFMASIGRFLTGIGAAFAAVNCLKLIANWFPSRQFAFMSGLMMTMAMLGAVGGQAPLAIFINTMDWRYAMEILAFAGLGLSILFWIIVRDRSPTHHKESFIASTKISLRESLKQVVKNPQSWWLSIYSGLAFAPVMVFGGMWGVSFMMEAFTLSQNISAQLVSLIFIGFAMGAPFFGWLSDWLRNRQRVMFWGTVVALISISTVIYLPTSSQAFSSLLLFAFGFSVSSSMLAFSMIREINLPILAATAIGFMNAFDAFIGAISDPLTGLILDWNWHGEIVDGARVFSVATYEIAFCTIPLYLALSLWVLTKTKETHCRDAYPAGLP